ncbi:alanine racemase [Sulfurimonas sp. SAG-AH-194-I05]|nr:alanine racemase [Sulfurimonas sp. SAG-AH-194-I05]MDF1874269.1 alanine racemase [Sulfurimonas sp. SAG-AH-194-I05]
MAYITLNKNNFFHNLDVIANKTKSKDKIALVLKDNAYGHGLLEVATMAQEYGIKRAVVKSHYEAKKIEDYFEYILVLAEIPHAKSEKIRYTINDINAIEAFPHATKVALKVDTGMHRNGIAIDALETALEKIKKQGLNLEEVFTHHRSADELTSEWFWQNALFAKVKAHVISLGYKNVKFHSANSASLFRYVDFSEDMARVGIAAYGCLQRDEAFAKIDLKPVLSLYAQKISSRTLLEGSCVGYGAKYTTREESIISNYDLGYGDGFFRICSNNYRTPHAKELVGRISMDNCSFLCNDEELLIFNDANQMAQSAQTISYEVLTSLHPLLKRKIKS